MRRSRNSMKFCYYPSLIPKPVASGWLVRLHQMLTLDKDEIIEYDDGRLVIRDPDLLASEVRPSAPAPAPCSVGGRAVSELNLDRLAPDWAVRGLNVSTGPGDGCSLCEFLVAVYGELQYARVGGGGCVRI